ncbi:YhjD/YihY/BrkB family envelope integrity protein [Prauserella flavalba]|uniref:YhjD/YihY/BrkB family envelope integrity protein n=1 Tax=Prauserella flavalba TaxID=1477506 RepID=UPI001FE7EAE5|nr:YhjD/YihY/BrkB family envelope integrity protein [Prauserella flavalba]
MARDLGGRGARPRISSTAARAMRHAFVSTASRYRWVRLTGELVRRDHEIVGTLLAAALAFRIFVWLLPCALIIAGLLGFGSSGGRTLSELARDTGLSPLTASLLENVGKQAEQSRMLAIGVGVGSLALASVALGRALDGVVNRVRPGACPRDATALVRAGRYSAVLLGTVAACLGGPLLRSVLHIPMVVLSIVMVAVFTLLGLPLLRAGQPGPSSALLPGAILFGLGLEALRTAAVQFLPGKLSRASELYGTLGVAAALLVWLMLMARFIVLAHVLNLLLLKQENPPRRSSDDNAP